MTEAETQEKISQLQALEHNLQNFLLQKQTFQSQLLEIESAMSELQHTNTAYKIIGNIMVKSDKQALQKELDDKKGIVGLRIKALERQEGKLKEEASRKQADVLADMKKKQA